MGGEKKAIAELVEELGRKTGAGLEECLFLLLSKGRAGLAEVAAALDGPRGESLSRVMRRRAHQVVEFLGAIPGGIESDTAQRVLTEVSTEVLWDRAWAFLERGQLSEAAFLAEVARDRDMAGHEYAWLMAKISMKKEDHDMAHLYYEEALRRAAPEAMPEILLDRAQALMEMGEATRAWDCLCQATSSSMEPKIASLLEGLLGEALWNLIARSNASEGDIRVWLECLPDAWCLKAAKSAQGVLQRAVVSRRETLKVLVSEMRGAVERLVLSAVRAQDEDLGGKWLLETESRSLTARKLAEDLTRVVGEYPHALKPLEADEVYDLEHFEDVQGLARALLWDIGTHWGRDWEIARERFLTLGEEVRHAILEAVPSSTGGQPRMDETGTRLWRATAAAWASTCLLEGMSPLDKVYRRLGPIIEAILENLATNFRLSGVAPVIRMSVLPDVQMEESRFTAALATLISVTAERNPGIPIHVAASFKEEVQEIEITVGPAEADGRGEWSHLAETENIPLVVAQEAISALDGCILRKEKVFRLQIPQSTVERDLSRMVPGYKDLASDTKQALKAAEAILQEEGASRDVRVSAFLYLKALEMEMERRLAPYLERHKLLTKAMGLARDPSSWRRLLQATYDPDEVPQHAETRLASLVKAIEKDRVPKESRDWNSLSLLLMVFVEGHQMKALGRELEGLEALRSWAAGSSSKGRPPADIEVAFERAKRATIKGLEYLGLVEH